MYWETVLDLELSTLIYVRSLREADFSMYIDALTELVPWFFALDHTHYACWIPIHLRDMAQLPNQHPEICRDFNNGHFTVKKTKILYSTISLDKAHEHLCCSGAACEEVGPSGWPYLGLGIDPPTHLATTNKLGLASM